MKGPLLIARFGHYCPSMRRLRWIVIVALAACQPRNGIETPAPEPAPEPERSNVLLGEASQLTLVGKRAGEGYFSADGKTLIFQSERRDDNPFYQIYAMDLDAGTTRLLSPGFGKTTCAWLHPDGERFLFGSTHEDPEAKQKQKEELEFRASGQTRRYSWDYDPSFDIYQGTLVGAGDASKMKNLTDTRGYDAEASYSPDGTLIAFASNRRAYNEKLLPEWEKRRETDPAFFIDLYVMNADGTNVRQITDTPGYDGGPFFSPDGTRITWRRFNPEGTQAEIWTAAVDGSDAKQLTQLGAMSWAPFYHPSGDYLIFTTNEHGYSNFELYMVDAVGAHAPVRVTEADGFDGLPVFTPAGDELYWTSNRAGDKGQIFRASWNDAEARRRLGLSPRDAAPAPKPPTVKLASLEEDVAALVKPELEGRLTGTAGERAAAEWLAGRYSQLGLEAPKGGYLQEFDFVAGVELGDDTAFRVEGEKVIPKKGFIPLAFSARGEFEPAPVVFAGYGIVAPKIDDQEAYDSYGDIDVTDKWVMMLRYKPADVDEARTRHLDRFSMLRLKATAARDKGARGILIVTGPKPKVKSELVPLSSDATQAGSGLAALSIDNSVARSILQPTGRSLADLQDQLDGGEPVEAFEISGVKVDATVDLVDQKTVGRNVVGRLPGSNPNLEPVLIGAHYDGQGRGQSGNSLASADEEGQVHPGADDNASGVAALLEIARLLKKRGPLKRTVIFAAWSGEELGLLGSATWAEERLGSPGKSERRLAAALNLDMVGRLREVLVLNGTGSSPVWLPWLEELNVGYRMPLRARPSSYLPTDATSFYVRGVPILSAFTGAHGEYHTPRDSAELLDYPGIARTARFFAAVATRLAQNESLPEYIESKAPEDRGGRRAFRVYLGTIPDYTQAGENGVKLTGVKPGTPAEAAGLTSGDVIVELAGKPIETIYDYVYALEVLKPGEATTVVIVRAGERMTLEIVPGSRD